MVHVACRPSAKAADGRTTRQRLPSVQRSVCAAAAKRSKSGGSMREQLQVRPINYQSSNPGRAIGLQIYFCSG